MSSDSVATAGLMRGRAVWEVIATGVSLALK